MKLLDKPSKKWYTNNVEGKPTTLYIGDQHKGSAEDFDSFCVGSIPASPTIAKRIVAWSKEKTMWKHRNDSKSCPKTPRFAYSQVNVQTR